jgi:hypothetical protein
MNGKRLPYGQFLTVRNLPLNCTEQQLIDLIGNRTGVWLPLENVLIDVSKNGHTRNGMISFPREMLAVLIEWALSEDRLDDHKLNFIVAPRAARLDAGVAISRDGKNR